MSNQIKHWVFCAHFFALIFFGFSNFSFAEISPKPAFLLRYEVVRTIPHDPAHYTQGLVFHDGKLFESVGRYGASALFEKELLTGRMVRNRANFAQNFAEGLAVADNKLIQLTWRERTAFIYDLTLQPLGRLHYDGEGWGLASIGNTQQLVLSDGSAQLRFLDSGDFHELRRITVHDGIYEIPMLNELEEADGLIYANVWLTNLIAVIAPSDGHVVAWLNLSALKASLTKPKGWDEREHVLNGIAYNPKTGHFFVTGKCWPVMFELALDRKPLKPQPQPAPQCPNSCRSTLADPADTLSPIR